MRKRGMTVIEVIVIILLFSVIFVWFVFGTVMEPMCGGGGSKTQDISNLKALVGLYISGQCDKKPMPKSTGHRFWLALFVGDPDNLLTGETGVHIDNVYAQPSQAGNLLCPIDQGALSKNEITTDFQQMIDNREQGWNNLAQEDNLYTSYAGPKSLRAFTDKSSSGIVGCDGSREGYGFFTDGFSVVNNKQGAEFKEYEQLAEKYPDEWTKTQDEPNWNSTLLQNVINITP